MPVVSVIVPCYNEQSTICLLLDALYSQSYPRAEMEVIIADGGSTDATRSQIVEFQRLHPDFVVRVVENENRTIPSGLNRAIEAACGEYIVRLDAHSVPRQDYVARCVGDLQSGLGDNVGGVWEIEPRGSGWQARAVAAAAAHPLGVGDAHYRYTAQAREVDTVPFGAFRRALIRKIGPFDESLLTNEDYEFNTRVRQSGGKVWLNPGIRSVYYARPDLPALARQYWRYGFWKARMLRRYPETLRWRQALPPVFVLSLVLFAAFSLVSPLALGILALEMGLYAGILLVFGLRTAFRKKDWTLIWGLPLAVGTMHLTWGAAFLWSLLVSVAPAVNNRKA